MEKAKKRLGKNGSDPSVYDGKARAGYAFMYCPFPSPHFDWAKEWMKETEGWKGKRDATL